MPGTRRGEEAVRAVLAKLRASRQRRGRSGVESGRGNGGGIVDRGRGRGTGVNLDRGGLCRGDLDPRAQGRLADDRCSGGGAPGCGGRLRDRSGEAAIGGVGGVANFLPLVIKCRTFEHDGGPGVGDLPQRPGGGGPDLAVEVMLESVHQRAHGTRVAQVAEGQATVAATLVVEARQPPQRVGHLGRRRRLRRRHRGATPARRSGPARPPRPAGRRRKPARGQTRARARTPPAAAGAAAAIQMRS